MVYYVSGWGSSTSFSNKMVILKLSTYFFMHYVSKMNQDYETELQLLIY